jgi:hypothetical protein
MNNKQEQPNAERIRRFFERIRREQMFKKGPTSEELGRLVQGPPKDQRKDKQDQGPEMPTE